MRWLDLSFQIILRLQLQRCEGRIGGRADARNPEQQPSFELSFKTSLHMRIRLPLQRPEVQCGIWRVLNFLFGKWKRHSYQIILQSIYGLWHKFCCVFLIATAIWKFFDRELFIKTRTYRSGENGTSSPNGGNDNDFDPLQSNDPSHIYTEYDKLRNSCPVAFTEKYNGYWLLSRYEDVKSVALDGTTYISSMKAVVPSDPRGLRRPPPGCAISQST
jgi:hypothetical protein